MYMCALAEQGRGQGELRILGDGLLQQLDRLRHHDPGQRVLVVGAIGVRERAQVEIVGFRILRRHAGDARGFLRHQRAP